MLKAILWDVDGTLAETERDGHRVAFNRAFESLGLPWRWDVARYGELLRVSGGRERLLHDMADRTDAPVLAGERLALARCIHERKNAHYAGLVAAGAVVLRPGVRGLLRAIGQRGLRMGIASTTSRSNVDALLRAQIGDDWAREFAVVVCGEDTQRKKPDPEVYQRALDALGIRALEALAIEDSPGGAAAARAADVPVLVARSAYFATDPIDGAVAIGPGLDDRTRWRPPPPHSAAAAVSLDDLIDWHRRMELVSQHG